MARRPPQIALPLLVALLATFMLFSRASASGAAAAFDVRQHLSTKAPYAARLAIPGAPSLHATPDPPGYAPAHLWLVSRHGTRWPTAERLAQIDALEPLLRSSSHQKWARNWTSPFAPLAPYVAGELHSVGEGELYSLAARLRDRFPALLAGAAYAPRRYPIVSSAVARAAASASAFALGFFPRAAAEPGLDAGARSSPPRPQPVALSMLPRGADPVLRFFAACPAYLAHEDAAARWLFGWQRARWSALAPALADRLGVPRLDGCDVDALWQLCAAEAALLGSGDGGSTSGGVCGLFGPADAAEMEWVEDAKLYALQGRGAAVNYEIAAPLLADAARSLRAAARGDANGAVKQRARLMFAHCETLTPLAALLGLFEPTADEAAALPRPPAAGATGVSAERAAAELAPLDASDDAPLLLARTSSKDDVDAPSTPPPVVKGKHRKHYRSCVAAEAEAEAAPQQQDRLPPPPPSAERVWRGGRVAPLGANFMLVLYRRTADIGGTDGTDGTNPRHLVRAVYNEQVVRLPGCSADDCDLNEFLERVVADKADAGALGRLCFSTPSADDKGGGSRGGGGSGMAALLRTADGLSLLDDGDVGGVGGVAAS